MAKAAGKYKGKAPLKQELYKSGTKQVGSMSQIGEGRRSEVKGKSILDEIINRFFCRGCK